MRTLKASVIRTNRYGLYVVQGEDGRQYCFTEDLLSDYLDPAFKRGYVGDQFEIVVGADNRVAEVSRPT